MVGARDEVVERVLLVEQFAVFVSGPTQITAAPDLRVACRPELLRYVVEKGSITVDGVSLTVVEADRDRFSVSLIPTTLELTTLGRKQPGDTVNLEVDVVAKYVERMLEWRAS